MLVFSGMKSTSMSSGVWQRSFPRRGGGGGRVDDTCFFRSVQKCLSSNLDLYYSVIEITEKIRGEVTKNGDMF